LIEPVFEIKANVPEKWKDQRQDFEKENKTVWRIIFDKTRTKQGFDF